MNPVIKNILAVIVGIIVGMAANMLLLMLLGAIIPPPEGVDVNDPESIREAMLAGQFKAHQFISPFLAHSAQSLLGAFVAVKIGASKQKLLAIIVGLLSLAGGIGAAYMFPAPTWYNVVDLVLAYIPMALIGWKLAGGRND